MQQTILITGATSGLGRAVALHLARRGVGRLILPVRSSSRGEELAHAIRHAGCAQVSTPLLDLASLKSVAAFVERFQEESGQVRLNGLLFNAGTQASGRLHKTVDGLETTFAVNHLAHHRLYRGLVRYLTSSAVIGWTSSGTHDPKDRAAKLTGFRGAHYQSADQMSRGDYPATDDEQRCRDAYATSKLCNLLSARHFAREASNRHRYFSFDPGLMPGTGLAREHGALARWAWKYVFPGLGRLGLIPGTSTPKRSGAILASLISGRLPIPTNGAYIDYTGVERLPYFPAKEEVILEDLIATSDALLDSAGAWRRSA